MRGLPFNMKLTAPVDIVKNFEKHIQKKACKEVIPSVHPTLEEMQKLRNSLDYQKIRTMITSDYKLAPDFQQQMINYLRYVYLIDNYFKDDFTNPKSSLKIGFQWTDSFQPKKSKEISNIKFELVSCLYNLAVCYYTEAIAYINIANTQEKLKGIAKLRNALWCIDEIRQNLPSILVNPADIPSDLNPSYINLLFNYFIGLTYATLADITGTDGKKTGFEKVASIHKAASKHFQIAYNIIAPLKPCPIPDPHDKYLKMNLVYNTVMMRSEALMQMAQQHLQKVDEEVRKGHMGLAVSYLRLSKFDFEEVMKTKSDLEYMAPEQKTSFIERSKQIKALYDDCLLKNQRVYQQPEYTADQLAGIPEEKTSITPTEPRDIKKKLDAERAFEIFMAPEILRIKNEFINVVNNRMFEAENALKNANGVKNKLYSEAYVNYLLDLHSQAGGKKAEIPAQLKAKIDKFRKNGAVNAYHHTRQNLQDTSAACTKIIQEIKGSLSAEKLEDESLRQQYPGQWTRPYSEQCNQEYVLKLKDLEQKLYIAQNTDNDILKKFTQYQDWMQKLSLPDEQILTLIPKSNDPEFLAQVKDQIGELVGIDQMIRNLVDLDKQRANLIAMTEEFFNGDFISAFAAIHARSVDKQTEFIKLLGPYEAKLAKVTNDINEAYPLMDFISSQAKGIMGSRKDSNQPAVKILEEINLAITVLNDIFSDFQQALNFYNNLVVNLNVLQKVVGDYCFAREIEKASLLQELQAQNNAGSMNASVNMNANAQPKLFDEEKLEFLMGNSQRMNQNRYPDAGAQFVNNQKQPQQQYPNYNPQAYSVPQNQGYPQMQPQPQNYAPVNQQHAQMYNQSNQGMNQQYSQPSFVPQQQQQQQQQPQPQPQPQQMMKELTSFDQLGSMVESTYIKPSNRR